MSFWEFCDGVNNHDGMQNLAAKEHDVGIHFAQIDRLMSQRMWHTTSLDVGAKVGLTILATHFTS